MTGHQKFLLISKVVPTLINFKDPKKIRRGAIHNSVCRLVKIPRSNQNIKLIKAVLLAMGVREVMIGGRPFYSTNPPRIWKAKACRPFVR